VWLTNYLSSYKNTLIISSHNIDFANQICNVILYIGNPDFKLPKLYTIHGFYDDLQTTISDIKKNATTAYTKMESEVEKMRKKSIKKVEVDKYIKDQNIPRPPRDYEIVIRFNEVSYIQTQSAIRLSGVSFGYTDAENILENIDYTIDLNSRHIIVADNGIGKSTLFKLCMQTIQPKSGYINVDGRVKIAYHSQHVVETMNLDFTAIEYLQNINPSLDQTACRAILGRVGLKKNPNNNLDHCTCQIRNLSGGQLYRLSFSGLFCVNPHLILFDEPSNNLDYESICALYEGINEYNGAVVVISHDTHLISHIDNYELFEIKNKKMK